MWIFDKRVCRKHPFLGIFNLLPKTQAKSNGEIPQKTEVFRHLLPMSPMLPKKMNRIV